MIIWIKKVFIVIIGFLSMIGGMRMRFAAYKLKCFLKHPKSNKMIEYSLLSMTLTMRRKESRQMVRVSFLTIVKDMFGETTS